MLYLFIVTAMGLKPSPSGETFRFYNFCPFEVWNTFWLWLSFLVLRVVMRCATDWNALDNPSLINCRGRYCVRSLVRIGLQSVAHETSPNLPASAGSGSVMRYDEIKKAPIIKVKRWSEVVVCFTAILLLFIKCAILVRHHAAGHDARYMLQIHNRNL